MHVSGTVLSTWRSVNTAKRLRERQFAGDQPIFIYARVIVVVDEIEAGRLTKYQPDRQQQQTANGQQGDAVRGPRTAARQAEVSAAVATLPQPVGRPAPRRLHGEDCCDAFSGPRLDCPRPIPRSQISRAP